MAPIFRPILAAVRDGSGLVAERFARVALPSSVRRLVFFLYSYSGGRRAETLAREAHGGTGLEIEVRYPGVAGADWNDVLLHRAAP